MSPADFAAMINGRSYGKEISRAESEQAKREGVVIVYGASDDNMEFAGAIYDEVGCYNGGTAYLTSAGLLTNDCDNEECPHFESLKKSAATIKAIWGKDGYSWTYETAIPHASFEVFDGLDTYCRGIAFNLSDVKGGA